MTFQLSCIFGLNKYFQIVELRVIEYFKQYLPMLALCNCEVTPCHNMTLCLRLHFGIQWIVEYLLRLNSMFHFLNLLGGYGIEEICQNLFTFFHNFVHVIQVFMLIGKLLGLLNVHHGKLEMCVWTIVEA